MSPDRRPPELDLSKLNLISRSEREHKVDIAALARGVEKGASFSEWFEALPSFLGAQNLRAVVDAVVAARKAEKPVVFAFGGHVIKTGCSPLVIDLIERGVITAVAGNGSTAIHDLELAETGATSEEVGDTIRDGRFGMVAETCQRMNEASRRGAGGCGLGQALGELLDAGDAPYKNLSIYAAAARRQIPAAIHVSFGADTVHMHPDADGAAIGAASMLDFRKICAVTATLGADGENLPAGVWLNVGSAVVMPEVFLKAVSVARNLGHPLNGLHTANFDMIQHYRPTQNVISRPVQPGFGHAVIGHHEILLPLLRQAIIERL